jgi:hypothetical protein
MISLKNDIWNKESCISHTKLLVKRAGLQCITLYKLLVPLLASYLLSAIRNFSQTFCAKIKQNRPEWKKIVDLFITFSTHGVE